MAVQKTDAATVVLRALELFRRQGYHQTSMAEVGAACGLLKGSLYHHFSSKEDLARAVMAHVHQRFTAEIFCWADDGALSAEDRLERMTAATEAYFLAGSGGCVMGNIALEAIDSVPEFGPALRAYFADWTAALARIFACRWDETAARRKAERAVAEIQGAIMMMRIHHSPDILVATTRALLDEFRAAP